MAEPDYNDDLAFEPKMTWEEFKEWVKEQESKASTLKVDKYFIRYEGITAGVNFYRNGEIWGYGGLLTENRTPTQMKTILENLIA